MGDILTEEKTERSTTNEVHNTMSPTQETTQSNLFPPSSTENNTQELPSTVIKDTTWTSPEGKDMWSTALITYEQQYAMLQRLQRLTKIYFTAHVTLYSVPNEGNLRAEEIAPTPPLTGDKDDTPHFTRVITMSAIMAVVDRVVRIRATDKVSLLGQALDG